MLSNHSTYLMRTPHGVWYFRIAVPRRLRDTLNLREIKRSLGTDSYRQAEPMARLLAYRAHSLFIQVNTHMHRSDTQTTMYLQIAKYLADMNGTVTIEGIDLDPTKPDEELRLLNGVLETVARSRPAKHANGRTGTATNLQAGTSLKALVRAYCEERGRGGNWSPKTTHENQAIFDLMLNIVGDVDCQDIDPTTARDYKQILQKVPRNMNKNPLFRGKSLDTVLKMKHSDPLAVQTVNKHLSRTRGLFAWATANGYVVHNHFEGLSIKHRKRAHEQREPFDQADLTALFGSKIYTNHEYLHSYYYWLPFLALCSGARLEELTQLELADIRCQDRVDVLDINNNGDKRLKSASSKRLIPIHSHLIESGFLRYVEDLRKRGETRLFPSLKRGRDGYGTAAAKWFARYRCSHGVKHRKKPFHSFRHTFSNHLKQQGLPEPQVAALLGHRNGSITYDRYGQPYSVAVLQTTVEKVDFRAPLGKVVPWPTKRGQ